MIDQGAARAFADHALQCYPREACGLILDGAYVPCDNVHEAPEKHFRIAPAELIKHSGFTAVLHSHPYAYDNPPKHPAFWPSMDDYKGYLASGVPWGVAATEGENVTPLVWLSDATLDEPLVGRPFIHGVFDCFSAVRSWFWQKRNILLTDYARGMDWWDEGLDLYEQNFKAAGFVEVPAAEMTIGDVLLFKVRSPVVSHAGVVTAPNEIYHHTFSQPSGHESISRWGRYVTKVVRYGS